MAIQYTQTELEEVVARYKAKYGDRVSWEIILNNIRVFRDNREAILNTPKDCLAWHGFLYYLAWIESTIGLYGYTKKGTFHRIFVMFGRAYLEEKEVINSKEGKDAGFSWIYDSSRYFKCGDGKKGDIDLHDPNGITYDVKNDYINFDKAHTADFLLKYRSNDGVVELHHQPTVEEAGSFVCVFAECRPLEKIAESLYLDPLLFDKQSSEKMIKEYLGLIN